MVLIIVATLVVLAFAFYQTIQGMFSAMIMAILAVLCSALALNFYEPLAGVFIGKGWLGAYADGACLLALFVVPLLVLREVFDRVIRGNVVMGMWANRIGGAAFGLISGFVLVGMLMIVVQLLPLPATILTYQPYDAGLQVHHGLTPRWAGQFVLGVGKHLSAGALSPLWRGQKYGLLHDDLLLEAFCHRNRPSGAWTGTPEMALAVADVYRVRMPNEKKLRELKLTAGYIHRLRTNLAEIQETAPTYPLLSPLQETELYVVRMGVDETARDEADNWWRLPATHFRLVTEAGKSFYPVGYLTFVGRYRVETVVDEAGKVKIADILVARPWKKQDGRAWLMVDWLYRLPPGEKPAYVVFRRFARDAVPPIADGLPLVDEKGKRLALDVKPVEQRRRIGVDFKVTPRGRLIWPVRMTRSRDVPDGFRARMAAGNVPEILKKVQLEGSRFGSGVLAGPPEDLVKVSGRRTTTVKEFATPSRQTVDQYGRAGTAPMRVIRVECSVAKSFVGDPAAVLERVDPRLILDDGEARPHSGAYLKYKAGAGSQLYLYYAQTWGRTGLDAGFADALRGHLAGVEKVGFLFLVPPERGRSAAGITFLPDGSYDFFAPDPLACYGGRR